MLDFITKFFKREEASKSLAKERLRLVLMSDRVSLAPELFDEMKLEMLSVIRRYLEIDERALDMHFENLEKQFALLASIPVLKVKTREQVVAWHQPTAHEAPAANGAASANGAANLAPGKPVINGLLEPGEIQRASGNGSTNGAQAMPPKRRRRRRRNPTPPPEGGAPPGASPPL